MQKQPEDAVQVAGHVGQRAAALQHISHHRQALLHAQAQQQVHVAYEHIKPGKHSKNSQHLSFMEHENVRIQVMARHRYIAAPPAMGTPGNAVIAADTHSA